MKKKTSRVCSQAYLAHIRASEFRAGYTAGRRDTMRDIDAIIASFHGKIIAAAIRQIRGRK